MFYIFILVDTYVYVDALCSVHSAHLCNGMQVATPFLILPVGFPACVRQVVNGLEGGGDRKDVRGGKGVK